MGKVTFFFCLLCITFAVARPRWHQLSERYSFEQYKIDFHKEYLDQMENLMRREIFEKNLHIILQHNENLASTYRMGVNHFTDWTRQELKAKNGYHKGLGQLQVTERLRKYEQGELINMKFNQTILPSSVDWRERNIISTVKDQGLYLKVFRGFVL
jgi:hypothetical protein